MTIDAFPSEFSYCTPSAGVGGAGEAAPASSNSNALLTPDALMAYCESRLGNIDSQMNSIFQAQQQYNGLTTDIDSLASQLNQYANSGINSANNLQADPNNTFANLNQEFSQLVTEAKKVDPQVATELQNAQNALNAGQDAYVGADEIPGIEKSLQQASSDVGAGAELNMINLQSLMSQRQTAIQLTTNLVQSLGDQSNAIATNIGK